MIKIINFNKNSRKNSKKYNYKKENKDSYDIEQSQEEAFESNEQIEN
jgi:hypothetical protein